MHTTTTGKMAVAIAIAGLFAFGSTTAAAAAAAKTTAVAGVKHAKPGLVTRAKAWWNRRTTGQKVAMGVGAGIVVQPMLTAHNAVLAGKGALAVGKVGVAGAAGAVKISAIAGKAVL